MPLHPETLSGHLNAKVAKSLIILGIIMVARRPGRPGRPGLSVDGQKFQLSVVRIAPGAETICASKDFAVDSSPASALNFERRPGMVTIETNSQFCSSS